MSPIITIVGRPGVGKSKLFNTLTLKNNALVHNSKRVTKDKKYGYALFQDHSFIVIDTPGLLSKNYDRDIDNLLENQTLSAVKEADLIYFVVDAESGLVASDLYIAEWIRRHNKFCALIINKSDCVKGETFATDFYSLGFKKVFNISAHHKQGITELLSSTVLPLSSASRLKTQVKEQLQNNCNSIIKLGLIGCPNSGKSTLKNTILGKVRMVTHSKPGTTIDSVCTPFLRNNESYTITDTAGIRRKSKIIESLEKFSINKTFQAIKSVNVVILVVDATNGLVDQDIKLGKNALKAGKAMVVAINKWDIIPLEKRGRLKEEIINRLIFMKDYIDIHFISALRCKNLHNLFLSVKKAYSSSMKKIMTADLNVALKLAVQDHHPPIIRGSKVKIKYAHIGGHNPPLVVIHTNHTNGFPSSYQRYLEKSLRNFFGLTGTPINFYFKNSKNN